MFYSLPVFRVRLFLCSVKYLFFILCKAEYYHYSKYCGDDHIRPVAAGIAAGGIAYMPCLLYTSDAADD